LISAQSTVVKGKIINSSDNEIELKSFWDSHSGNINPDGSYKIAFKTEHSRYYNFKNSNTEIKFFLGQNDTVELSYDAENIQKSIEFKGKMADYNKKLFLLQGKDAPDFSFRDRNDSLVSLSDFKGKYIYLDVWNTKCMPCLKEFPHYDKLRKKYNENNIVFIAVSLDKDKKSWEAFLDEKKLKGIQLFAGGWDPEFTENYLVYGCPRYILINREHKIINSFAPKPSGGLSEVLKELDGL
jgi:peroxiredoxin